MPVKTKNSLLKRLFLISLPLTILAGLLYGVVIAYIEARTLKQNQVREVYEQINQLAKIVAIPTWNLDHHFLRTYLAQYSQDPHLICIELVSDADLKERAPEGCTHPENSSELHSSPIIYENQYIGVVIASFDVDLDDQRLAFILLTRIPVALLALLSIFFVVFLVFRRWVITPIQAIMLSIEKFQTSGEHEPVDWASDDEVGTLVETFNDAQQRQMTHEKTLTSAKEKAEGALLELQETQSQLVESEKMASLGSLVAGISHEINTPLGVARTSSSHIWDAMKKLEHAFKNGTLTKAEMQEFLDVAEDGLHLMTANLVRASDLMASFKQVSADQSHDEQRTFPLKEYLQETVYTLKPNLKRYQVAVIIECPDNIMLNSYPGAYSQVITNLIMNALNHAYEPENKGTIKIKVEPKGHQIQIRFSDDGKGMSEKIQRQVFDPFFTTKRGKGGTGLGMHIIYNLVTHKLEGNIEVTSEENVGTTFIITLPIELSGKESNLKALKIE